MGGVKWRLGCSSFNSIEWILQDLVRPILDKYGVNFQFHWMDSILSSSGCFVKNSMLSIPLNGFLAQIQQYLLGKVVHFQFHWMDSPRIYQLAQIEQYLFFQFHWMDSEKAEWVWEEVRGKKSFNSIEWIRANSYLGGEDRSERTFNSIEWIPMRNSSRALGLSKPSSFNSIEWIQGTTYTPYCTCHRHFQFHWMDS